MGQLNYAVTFSHMEIMEYSSQSLSEPDKNIAISQDGNMIWFPLS